MSTVTDSGIIGVDMLYLTLEKNGENKMRKMKKVIQGGALMLGAAVLITVPAFAACTTENLKSFNLSTTEDKVNYPVKCGGKIKVEGHKEAQHVWGKTSADCSKAATLAANPEECSGSDLDTVIKAIINTVIFAVGIVAVVMVILGGVQYSTSQGDTQKVKKAKDTIMYGIIGLVVAILAFAIVNFVLSGVF